MKQLTKEYTVMHKDMLQPFLATLKSLNSTAVVEVEMDLTGELRYIKLKDA